MVLGVYQGNWQRLWDLVQAHDGLYAAFGLHPVYLEDHHPQHLLELRDWLGKLAGHRKLCAVGEFGLDYYLEHLDRQRQQALFEAQLQLAAEFELPVLLHVRRAHAATIATLKRFRLARGGIIHAFAGSYEEAREYIKLGFRLGLLAGGCGLLGAVAGSNHLFQRGLFMAGVALYRFHKVGNKVVAPGKLHAYAAPPFLGKGAQPHQLVKGPNSPQHKAKAKQHSACHYGKAKGKCVHIVCPYKNIDGVRNH